MLLPPLLNVSTPKERVFKYALRRRAIFRAAGSAGKIEPIKANNARGEATMNSAKIWLLAGTSLVAVLLQADPRAQAQTAAALRTRR